MNTKITDPLIFKNGAIVPEPQAPPVPGNRPHGSSAALHLPGPPWLCPKENTGALCWLKQNKTKRGFQSAMVGVKSSYKGAG